MGDDDPKWVKERPHFDVGGEAADAATIAVSHSDDVCESKRQQRRLPLSRQHHAIVSMVQYRQTYISQISLGRMDGRRRASVVGTTDRRGGPSDS